MRRAHAHLQCGKPISGIKGWTSEFNALRSSKHDHEAQLYASDVLAMGGDHSRQLPLHLRKTNLQRLLAHRPDGITVALFERGEIGPKRFRAACRMGLEGLVSKYRDRPHRGERQKHWGEDQEPQPSRNGAGAVTPLDL
ncbi:ATP-dependent DNA ligase [Bradyrhizobium sp. LM6.11]